MKPIVFSFLMSLIYFFSVSVVFACSCNTLLPPCYAYSITENVFVGTVKEVIKDNDELRFDKIKIEVEQNFKGMERKTVFSYSHHSSTYCQLSFSKDAKYLFYGSLSKNGEEFYSDGYCGRTTYFENASVDLDFLNSLNNKTPIYWAWGTFTDGYGTSIEGIKAEILDGKKKITAISDKNGNIKFPVSKAGKYKIRVYLQKKMTPKISDFYEQFHSLKRKRVKKGIYTLDYVVDVKSNKCGWFDVPINQNN